MAGETNADYDGWHLVHNGSRVRKSLGVKGNYVSKYAIASWIDGSHNKAVYETALINGQDVSGYNGLWEYDVLKSKIIVDMLYGKNGEAQGTSPIDTASFRAYPTPIVTLALNKELVSNDIWGYDGNLTEGTAGHRYAVISTSLSLTYYLPFDVILKVRLRYDGTPYEDMYLKIESGSLSITHYSKDNITYSNAVGGLVYFSNDVTTQVGDKTIALDLDLAYTIPTLPHYGDTSLKTVTITSSDVNPPPSWVVIYQVATISRTFLIIADTPTSWHVEDAEVDNRTTAYVDENDGYTGWAIGRRLANSIGGSLGLSAGDIFSVDDAGSHSTNNTNVILKITIDANGVITDVNDPI